MDELKQKAIKSHHAKLVECMNPLLVMDHLANLLSLEQAELIRESHSARRERNRELIAVLFKIEEELEPFERFVEVLKKTDASHAIMAEAVLKTYKHRNCAAEFQKISTTSLSAAEEIEYNLQM
uniref:CARD domain-containing protein n=1 Tax=Plectus sambesii TaxID=2011161 RepID=A0A914XKQ1_9BILA